MRINITIQDIKNSKVAHLNQHLFREPETEKKQNKYRNTPTMVNGIKFQSKKEARRYKDLLLLQKAGKIGMLRLQVRYELNEGGEFSYVYVADFVYIESDTGLEIVEDAKGTRTREYKKKKRLMKKVYGITIKET